jgi:hypothetical protein
MTSFDLNRSLLLTYHMTGDRNFLEPIRLMADARLEWIRGGKPNGTHAASR